MSAADMISVLSFALHTTHVLCKIGKKWLDAPKEMKSLLGEVSRVQGLLRQILQANTSGGMESASVDVLEFHPELIAQAEELTNMANVFVDKVTIIREDGTREVKRTKWTFKASEAKGLTTKFHNFFQAVSAIYAVDVSTRAASMERNILVLKQRMLIVEKTQSAQHDAVPLKAGTRPVLKEIMEGLAWAVARTLISAVQQQREGRSQLFDEFSILRNNPDATRSPPADCYCPATHPEDNRVATAHSVVKRCSSTRSSDSDVQCSLICGSFESSGTERTALCTAGSRPSNSIFQLNSTCSTDCRCRCHQPPRDLPLVPSALASWLGNVYIPGLLVSSLTFAVPRCDDERCVRTRDSLSTFRRWLPTWFARVEATMRSCSCPIQFVIQTPRIVPSLEYLVSISLDEFRTKLSKREITVYDAQEHGFAILHGLAQRAAHSQRDLSEVFAMMHLAINAGARHDWEYFGFTVMEYMAHYSKRTIQDTSKVSSLLLSFELNVTRPLLRENIEEAWDSIRTKRKWNDLHSLFANPPSSPAQLMSDLAGFLNLPSAALDVNAKDRYNRTPLCQAIEFCPQAVDALLRAGADPHLALASPLGYAARTHSWSAVGPLIRAGADVSKSVRWFNGMLTNPLHDVVRRWSPRVDDQLRTAQELVRHGGHMLDWDARDECERTPLDWASSHVNKNPFDQGAAALYGLYKTRKLPPDAHLAEHLFLEKEDMVASLASMSLTKAGLEGNVPAIGSLINAGAMVNERDEAGNTLLHLVAMGVVPNGYAVALEVVRHGGYGVDWDARTMDGQTAEDLARQTLEHLSVDKVKGEIPASPMRRLLQKIVRIRRTTPSPTPYKVNREETTKILALLEIRSLPEGVDYVYPCMSPDYCMNCSSRPCLGHCDDGLRMPGSWH